MPNITLLPSAKVPLIYDGTTMMSTEWYRFFWNVYGFTGDPSGAIPVNKGGTGLTSIGEHQFLVGTAVGTFEPTTLVGSGVSVTYSPNTITLAIGNSGVTPGTYGSASNVGQFTVDIHGTLVFAQNVPIAINANQITSGTIDPARISGSYTGITGVGTLTVGTWNATTIATNYGGTGLTSFTSGGAIYATSTSALTSGTLPVTAGGTNATTASITSFNNITGYTASGATGTTSSNLVFSAIPTFGTTIGVGAASASASGAGITFPATQNASTNVNTLDDYEEGTWTPTITPLSGSLTSYTSSGTYIKIGKLVSLSFIVSITNAGTASSVMQVSNLPFNTTGANTSAGVMRENAVIGISGALVAVSSTVLYGAKYDGGTPFTTGYAWICQYTYQATA